MTAPRRVVIVGGGIAGWTVATALREGGFDGAIAVIEREPACYDRPPLSKTVLIDDAPLNAISFADAEAIAAARIDVRAGRSAVALDAGSLAVVLDDRRRVDGDAVVLATGAPARRGAFPGADAPGVRTLRTYADAVALRALAARRVAVVGGGLVGAESAAALRGTGAEVSLIDPNPVPALRTFGPVLAAHLHAMHEAAGVRTVQATVAAVDAADAAIRVHLSTGDALAVDGVLVATGIGCDTALAGSAGLEVDGGIVVDDAGRTSVPGIFAAGDATRRRTATGLAAPGGHWDAARLDGRAVAAAILGEAVPARGADWFWSDRYGHHVEVVGEMTGPGDDVVRAGEHPTVFRLDGTRVTAAASVDDPLAVRAARRLIERGISVEAERLADPAVPLRSLIPRS